ncbi:hypothetical protein HBN50_09330 [Halobacteriovorax sp. GB3]|uniref:hypothetical protein n=1 Tax=Halobacteriovorax sp. GB3 TaxID=2719615 RepID=UPI00235FF343|nr:hypothetical protein [Halobacteriovorax sp. GB3]MDD0853300.1 hypothetical protein [Halobacteriovorax sp. GB3]
MKKLLLIALTTTLATSSLAQSTATTLSGSLESESTSAVKNWNVSVSSTTSASVVEADSYDNYVNSSLSARLSYKLNDRLTAQSSVAAAKEMKGARKQYFSSAYLGLSGLIKSFNSDISLSGLTRVYLPVNANSRRDTTFNGRVMAGLSGSFNLAKLGLKYVSLTLSSTGAKNFHEFKRTRTNSPNTNYYVTNTAALGYAPFKKVSFSFYFSNTSRWDYENKTKGDTFSMGQSVYWALEQGFSISAGHDLGGLTYGYTGDSLDVALFDKNKSSVYTSVSYVY